MKKRIASILILLFTLTSCSSNKTTENAFVKSAARGSVYDNCYVTVSSNKLTYYDLDTGVSTPVCSAAGCKHDGSDSNCTAIIENEILSNPFRYSGKLYYFGFGDNQESRMYKCEENGSSRETVLEFKRSGNEEEYISPMIFSAELYEDKIYLLILESVMKKTNEFDGNYGYGTSGMANYKIGCFDLVTDSYSVIYETGICPDSNMQIYGIYNDIIYLLLYGADDLLSGVNNLIFAALPNFKLPIILMLGIMMLVDIFIVSCIEAVVNILLKHRW